MARLPGVEALIWQKDWDLLKSLLAGEGEMKQSARDSRCEWLAMRIAAQMNWNDPNVEVTPAQVVAVAGMEASTRTVIQNPANN